MAPPSIIPAWEIPWAEEPGGLHTGRKESDTADDRAQAEDQSMKFRPGSAHPAGHFSQFMMHCCFELAAGLALRYMPRCPY